MGLAAGQDNAVTGEDLVVKILISQELSHLRLTGLITSSK
jgi:hypothetical protein